MTREQRLVTIEFFETITIFILPVNYDNHYLIDFFQHFNRLKIDYYSI